MVYHPLFTQQHVALVTGGSRGIGQETVKGLAASNVKVAFTYHRHKEEAEMTCGLLVDSGIDRERILPLFMDLHKPESVQEAVDTVVRQWGYIDILVNNAVPPGWLSFDLLSDPPEKWHEMIDGGLTGVYYTCRAAIPSMIKRSWGRIVTVTSTIALRGKPKSSHYAAAKAGLIGFTYSLAQEYSRYHILSNLVAPGLVRTERVLEQSGEDYIRAYEERNPSGRSARPEDVAHAILYLSSENNSFINGQTITVDGGMNPK